jgi:MarR family transcriptional regulator, 2-MHQ and catechol-resistance regulon repressor
MPSPIDDERLTAAGLFFEAHAGLSREVERGLAASGLSAQWFEVLIRLARTPGGRLRMCDLAAQVSLSPSGLTRAVDRLEAAGLVRREGCPDDGRGAFAVLTDAGRARVAEALPAHLDQLERSYTGVLSSAELGQLVATLRKLRDHVNPDAAVGT